MEAAIGSKKALEVELSRINGFISPKVRVEQYMTEPEIAAEVLWSAYMKGKVRDRVVADLGCGTGILGIGGLLLGARKAYFVDSDEEALEEAKRQNEKLKSEGFFKGEAEFFLGDVAEFSAADVETVIQNPPFGTKEKHADRVFLGKAFGLSDSVYSFHKREAMKFLEAFSKDNNFVIKEKFFFEFPLKKTMKHHEKRVKKIKVVACHFEKQK